MDVMAATATVPFLGAFGGSWRGSMALKTLLCYGDGAVGRKSYLWGARQAFLLVAGDSHGGDMVDVVGHWSIGS